MDVSAGIMAHLFKELGAVESVATEAELKQLAAGHMWHPPPERMSKL